MDLITLMLVLLAGIVMGLLPLAVYHNNIKHQRHLADRELLHIQETKDSLETTSKGWQNVAAQRLKEMDDQRANIQQSMTAWKLTHEKTIRDDANKRSRAVMRGQATEHLAPFMMNGFNAKDFRFMGDPIDYLICVGTSDIHDGTLNRIEQVVLLDIKTGKSQLSKVQRRIRDAVVEGRVVFATYNTDTEVLRKWPDNDSK